MHSTIADAIASRNSIRQFTICYRPARVLTMDKAQFRVERLRNLVAADGGPAEFARKRSRVDADKPIDATYISQILNGHRSFGEKSALNMIRRAGLPADYFDIPSPAAEDFRRSPLGRQLMDDPSGQGPTDLELEEMSDIAVVEFARKRATDHPAIEEVVRLMLEMEEAGKWIMAGEARQIVKEFRVHKKQTSSSQ